MDLPTTLKLGQLYLKTVDRNKVTPEGVIELASILGREISAQDAATVANSIRTRGRPDAMSLAIIAKVAALGAGAPKSVLKEMTVRCDTCGTLKVIQFDPAEVPDIPQE